MIYSNCVIVIADSRKELKNFLECFKIGCKKLFRLNGIWAYTFREDQERQRVLKSDKVEILDTFELLDKMESMRRYCPTNKKHLS